jgi:hypothetical protein
MISFRVTNSSRWNSCIGVVVFLASDWYANLLATEMANHSFRICDLECAIDVAHSAHLFDGPEVTVSSGRSF